MADQSTADEVIDWIIEHALASDDVGVLLDGLCTRQMAAGLPVLRASISLPTLDPDSMAIGYIWRRGEALAIEVSPHGEEENGRFQRSVIYSLLARDIPMKRWRLERDEGVSEFELLRDLRSAGATDYILRIVRFGRGETALFGVALSMATDRPGGFTENETAGVHRLVPALALAVYRISVGRTATDALGLYLGENTARRVLAGEIRRGEGETIAAAILYADLRGFTHLAEREDPQRVVGWLNEHLDLIGNAVTAEGGEILKFLGDGLLAVFPANGGCPSGECEKPLCASLAALAANRELNESRRVAGQPRLDLDVALHFGDVIYGNVGAARRLDFTVIGRAVNEASRMEGLCAELDRNLVMSAAFAERCGRPTVSLGSFALRSLVGERTLFGLESP